MVKKVVRMVPRGTQMSQKRHGTVPNSPALQVRRETATSRLVVDTRGKQREDKEGRQEEKKTGKEVGTTSDRLALQTDSRLKANVKGKQREDRQMERELKTGQGAASNRQQGIREATDSGLKIEAGGKSQRPGDKERRQEGMKAVFDRHATHVRKDITDAETDENGRRQREDKMRGHQEGKVIKELGSASDRHAAQGKPEVTDSRLMANAQEKRKRGDNGEGREGKVTMKEIDHQGAQGRKDMPDSRARPDGTESRKTEREEGKKTLKATLIRRPRPDDSSSTVRSKPAPVSAPLQPALKCRTSPTVSSPSILTTNVSRSTPTPSRSKATPHPNKRDINRSCESGAQTALSALSEYASPSSVQSTPFSDSAYERSVSIPPLSPLPPLTPSASEDSSDEDEENRSAPKTIDRMSVHLYPRKRRRLRHEEDDASQSSRSPSCVRLFLIAS